MSTAGNVQQLRQDLQNELITANELLGLISIEVQKIKNFTNPGSEFEANIKQPVNHPLLSEGFSIVIEEELELKKQLRNNRDQRLYNVATIANLASLQQMDIENLPPVRHLRLDDSQ